MFPKNFMERVVREEWAQKCVNFDAGRKMDGSY
jgi:hypothetical protein